MALSRAEVGSLRDAIQDLLFYAQCRPTSLEERQEAEAAWQTIDRLTTHPISVPGEDAQTWTFHFRKDAWAVFSYTTSRIIYEGGAIKRIKDCQDTLRVLLTREDTSPRTRGRKRTCDWRKDKDVAENWERAKGAGIVKKGFARDNGISVKELDRILNRHAKRARTKPVK